MGTLDVLGDVFFGVVVAGEVVAGEVVADEPSGTAFCITDGSAVAVPETVFEAHDDNEAHRTRTKNALLRRDDDHWNM